MREVERRADEYGLLPMRWPDAWPGNTLAAMRAATFAQQAGRAVAFSLAAFRQAFAGGKDLTDVDNVLIAAAACELHPNAVLKGIEIQSIKDRLRQATDEAYERGVRGVPSVAWATSSSGATTTSRRPPRPSRRLRRVSRDAEAAATRPRRRGHGRRRRARRSTPDRGFREQPPGAHRVQSAIQMATREQRR